jgi:hypothetical protein
MLGKNQNGRAAGGFNIFLLYLQQKVRFLGDTLKKFTYRLLETFSQYLMVALWKGSKSIGDIIDNGSR